MMYKRKLIIVLVIIFTILLVPTIFYLVNNPFECVDKGGGVNYSCRIGRINITGTILDNCKDECYNCNYSFSAREQPFNIALWRDSCICRDNNITVDIWEELGGGCGK